MKKIEILEKIEPLFFEKSYQSVSLKEIADIFEIKKSSLYYYFESKENMFLDLLDYSFNKYFDFIDDLIIRWNEDNFQELLLEFINFWEKNKNIFFKINNSNWIYETKIMDFIQEKHKIIFEKIHFAFQKKANFTKEKTYIFLISINQSFRENWVYGKCWIDKSKIPEEIEKIFFNLK